jgi:plasmid stability protein
MPRPLTEAADYERFPARLPKDVIQALRIRSAKTGAPINTELVKVLRQALRLPPKERDPSSS